MQRRAAQKTNSICENYATSYSVKKPKKTNSVSDFKVKVERGLSGNLQVNRSTKLLPYGAVKEEKE